LENLTKRDFVSRFFVHSYFTKVNKYALIKTAFVREKEMCEVHELVRGFILKPGVHYRANEEMGELAQDLQLLQNQAQGEFDVCLLKGGGVVIYLPPEFPQEEILDATEYLADKLGITPQIIDLSRAT